jgi:hypothetical protein
MDSVMLLSDEDMSKVVTVTKHVPDNGHSKWKNLDLENSDIG